MSIHNINSTLGYSNFACVFRLATKHGATGKLSPAQQQYQQQLRVVYIASCLAWAWSSDVSQCLFTFSDLSCWSIFDEVK